MMMMTLKKHSESTNWMNVGEKKSYYHLKVCRFFNVKFYLSDLFFSNTESIRIGKKKSHLVCKRIISNENCSSFWHKYVQSLSF